MTHAPIAIGTRFATDAEVQHFHRLCQQSNVDPHSDVVVDLPSGTPMRRLDVRNAHERRMIWYALARAWGAMEEEADTAHLRRIGKARWALEIVWTRPDGSAQVAPGREVGGADLLDATEALCRMVWP